jgi:Outer membrane protein beta-barrel domain
MMRILLRVALFALVAAYASGATAQNSPPRGGKWEFTLQPQYVHGETFNSGNGSAGSVGSSLGFGFGVGYNLNNHLTLGGDFFWNQGNYDVTLAPAAGNPNNPQSVSGTLSTSTIRFNATWNFLQGDFTPFVIGGIGSTYVDTNIPSAPPQNQCWYDPWWGYYCGTYTPTRYAYYVSYSGGVGVRWDLDRNIFLRALGNRMWIDVGGSIGQPYVDQYRFDVGFKF